MLIAVSEILANITGLEYAFKKAPANMRSLVMSIFLFTSAVSAVLGEGLLCALPCLIIFLEARINALLFPWQIVGLSADPLLVWNYAVMAGLAGVGGCAFWLSVRQLDVQEEELNKLSAGHVGVAEDGHCDEE